MKTMMKRVAGAAMAALLAVAVLVTATPVQAVAAGTGTGTLTVKSNNKGFAGKDVTVWKMFDVTVGDGGSAGYTLSSEWEAFFKNGGLEGFNGTTLDGPALSEAAYTYIKNLGEKDAPAVTAFAKKAAAWAKGQDNLTSVTKKASAEQAPYTAEFKNLAYGYYLVVPADGSSDATRTTSAMLYLLKAPMGTIDLKSEYPTVEKTVLDGDTDQNSGSDAQVGDTLTFTLTSTVPELSEYQHFNVRFVDTLSKGLTFGSVTEVKIGDNKVLTKGDDLTNGEYTVSCTAEAGKPNTLTITLKDLKQIEGIAAGQDIVVTYTAKLNEHAVVGNADGNIGNKNSALVEWGTDPQGTFDGSSKPSETHTYTFGFQIKKVDGADRQTALQGVEFQIKDAKGGIVKLVATQPNGGADPLVVRPATTEGEGVEKVVTPASGLIKFEGFDAGNYTLVEVKPLDGYNKLPDQAVVIAPTYNQDGTLNTTTITIGGKPGDQGVFVIENNKGALLPGTGGIGTVLFTLGGAALIGYGIYRKRTAATVA